MIAYWIITFIMLPVAGLIVYRGRHKGVTLTELVCVMSMLALAVYGITRGF